MINKLNLLTKMNNDNCLEKSHIGKTKYGKSIIMTEILETHKLNINAFMVISKTENEYYVVINNDNKNNYVKTFGK